MSNLVTSYEPFKQLYVDVKLVLCYADMGLYEKAGQESNHVPVHKSLTDLGSEKDRSYLVRIRAAKRVELRISTQAFSPSESRLMLLLGWFLHFMILSRWQVSFATTQRYSNYALTNWLSSVLRPLQILFQSPQILLLQTPSAISHHSLSLKLPSKLTTSSRAACPQSAD